LVKFFLWQKCLQLCDVIITPTRLGNLERQDINRNTAASPKVAEQVGVAKLQVNIENVFSETFVNVNQP
jgi:hypothetical protein